MTAKQKINLSLIILIALVILISFSAIRPILEDIKNNSEESISQKENSATLEAKIENLENFKTTYKNLGDFSKKVDALFVNAEVPVGFIGFLENIAEAYHLKIDIVPASVKAIDKNLWSYLNFQISILGSYPNFLKFQKKLENSPYLLEIQNLNIIVSNDTGDIRASFTIKAYAR